LDAFDFARLTRIEHAFMLCAAVVAGEIIALQDLPQLQFVILSCMPAFFIEISAFAINDYFDIETDRKNSRFDRPLVSGHAKPAEALSIAVASALAGVLAAWFINLPCFAIALAAAAFSFLYSFRLKDKALVGNTYVALTMAVPFVFGNLAVGMPVTQGVGLLALIAFVMGLAREIMGAVRDVEGDRERKGSATFPMLVGEHFALLFASFLYVLAVALSVFPFLFVPLYRGDATYLFLVAICDLMLLWVAGHALSGSREFLKTARGITLAAMAIGLVAFLVGAKF
jgi:geranylgeranylglycerol-phosphate geranylgeranyltransferase